MPAQIHRSGLADQDSLIRADHIARLACRIEEMRLAQRPARMAGDAEKPSAGPAATNLTSHQNGRAFPLPLLALAGARALALATVDQKIIHFLAGLELQHHPARLLAPAGPRFGRV